ncbi:MAG: GGDEF domain-containing protein [Bdellovibrionaceae bacterium]|nr:GGDEF domain-containing protein [Pseudobdellovibrionaceae bacterium]
MVPVKDDTNEKTIVASDTTLKKELSKTDSSPPVLVVLIGPAGYQGKQWNLQDGFVIGRAIESNIFIDDKSLSRSHARVDIKGDSIYVVDLGSTNKTMVNGQIIPPMVLCELKNNDQVKTGNVIFKYLETGNIESLTTQALFEKATRDALTGAYSKGALLEKGPEAIKRSEILNEPMSVIIFDIDFFKKINDSYGHPCGDFVLKELAKVISTKLIRSNDFFARYGGEEFVLILSGTEPKISAEIAERIRMTIQNHEFVFENKRIPVTISLGVSSKLSSDTEWAALLERVDKALYTSKQTGRNKVTQV